MPYIKLDLRENFDIDIDTIAGQIQNSGDLTYVIYKLLLKTLPKKYNYANLAHNMGVISCVKEEFYRKIVAPYEELKIKENGDITL